MRDFFRWLWCALRGHPYPLIAAEIDFEDPLLRGLARCPHCGADRP